MKVRTKSSLHDRVLDEQMYQCLKPNSLYSVVEIDDEYFRVIDEAGEPILYPKALFTVVDPRIPDDWIREDGTDGTYYINPPGLGGCGFYEDLFDGVASPIQTFRQFVCENIRYFDGDANASLIEEIFLDPLFSAEQFLRIINARAKKLAQNLVL